MVEVFIFILRVLLPFPTTSLHSTQAGYTVVEAHLPSGTTVFMETVLIITQVFQLVRATFLLIQSSPA